MYVGLLMADPIKSWDQVHDGSWVVEDTFSEVYRISTENGQRILHQIGWQTRTSRPTDPSPRIIDWDPQPYMDQPWYVIIEPHEPLFVEDKTMNHTLTQLVKQQARFTHYQSGQMHYEIALSDDAGEHLYGFAVPVEDVGNGVLSPTEPAIYLMRWLRKAIENEDYTYRKRPLEV